MFHWLVGTPFDQDDGEFDGLTLWEQMDNGQQFTPSKKFLTVLPIVMFLASTHYTHYDATLFFINLLPLVVVLIGKLPQMHRVRLFGINMENRMNGADLQTPTGGQSRATSARLSRRSRHSSHISR